MISKESAHDYVNAW